MINIIEKALNKLGYYKSDMPEGSKASEADILEMFNTYGQTKVFKDLLHNLLDRDKDLHFTQHRTLTGIEYKERTKEQTILYH